MTPLLRPDLDGYQLLGEDELWLVYHGRRHRVPEPVQLVLFRGEVAAVADDVSTVGVGVGPDLTEGTCLMRADGDLAIYLVVCTEGGVERCPILNWESFCDFRFDEGAVRAVPRRVLDCVPMGRGITSAASRVPK